MIMMMPKWIFENMSVPVYPGRHRLYRAPPDPPRHHDRATPAPHISPRCPQQNNCRRFSTRRAGACRGALPGTDRSLLGNGADPRERRVSQHLRRPFPPGVAPTLTSRHPFHTKFNMQITTPILRYKYDTNFKIFFSTRFFSLKSKKKVKNEFPELAPRQN